MKLESIGIVTEEPGGFILALEESFKPALEGLEAFSHALVLYWCHELEEAAARRRRTCESPYRTGPDSLGVFATRSPERPNPVALTTISIERIDGKRGLVRTPYIDAMAGSPLIDIKPYVPAIDRVRDFEPPAWCRHWPQWVEDSASFDWPSELLSTPNE